MVISPKVAVMPGNDPRFLGRVFKLRPGGAIRLSIKRRKTLSTNATGCVIGV
ncbi:hypothetical protein HNQ99_003070 [Rhizorhapis suberifaciens]|uniref:Uncharacterized protein n=1 Tax=Rhizorhapis suberifaciens TaxID=13656 RepID=A0A840HZ84_9SPHN|nr:hypothetical protein [Rhizorhapis suberifaciens]